MEQQAIQIFRSRLKKHREGDGTTSCSDFNSLLIFIEKNTEMALEHQAMHIGKHNTVRLVIPEF